VQRTFAILALLVGFATSAQAQKSWQSEIGIQGGFVRVKPAGTGRRDQIDAFAVPGANYVLGLLTHGTVYAVIPWSDKVAVEPSVVFSQLNGGGGTNSTGRLGVRVNYALTPKFYAGAGGALVYVDAATQHSKSLGLHGAVGYRMHLTGNLNSRIEANFTSTKKTKDLSPFIGYGVLFGVSTRLGGGAGSAPAPSRRSAPQASAWQPVLGIAGGYFSSHTVGGPDVNGIAVPALGGSLTGIGTFLGNPPTMFAIFPIGTKIALEPGLDIVRVQQPGPNTSFSANMSARLDYAVHKRWYAAAGANFNYMKVTGTGGGFIPGANVAWGYRFPFNGTWGGRVELNYALFAKNTKLGTSAQNIFGVMLGVTTPIR